VDVEQEKIDVAHATPVSSGGVVANKPVKRGAPMWLQLLLSLVVIVVAVGVAALFNTTANDMVQRIGVKLPMLTASDDASAAPQAGTQTAQAGGQRQGGGQGAAGGRSGAGAFNRTAVVVTAATTTGTINNKLSSIGEGIAIQSVTVSSAQGGTLLTVDVKPGDVVKAGQQLATLDSDSQKIAYDKAVLAQQDADATLARTQSLGKSNSVSDAQVATAQLAASQAKLAVNDAKVDLDDRTIVTPVGGVVGIIQATPGNLINAQTVITTVQDSSKILVNFWVPERYSSQIQLGQQMTAESAAVPGATFSGTVTAIDNKVDPASRTLQVQATLPNDKATLKAGMSFTVDLTFPGETFPSVDPLSVQWSNTGAYVWKVVDGKAVKGMVEIVQRNSDGVLVQGDVKTGDPVVTQGVLQLSDNLPVRLLDNGTSAPAATKGGGGQGQNQAPTKTEGGGAAGQNQPAPQNQGG
jgi:RND family efflux transporter MFP subunit